MDRRHPAIEFRGRPSKSSTFSPKNGSADSLTESCKCNLKFLAAIDNAVRASLDVPSACLSHSFRFGCRAHGDGHRPGPDHDLPEKRWCCAWMRRAGAKI
jgi:hypothetical protein